MADRHPVIAGAPGVRCVLAFEQHDNRTIVSQRLTAPLLQEAHEIFQAAAVFLGASCFGRLNNSLQSRRIDSRGRGIPRAQRRAGIVAVLPGAGQHGDGRQ